MVRLVQDVRYGARLLLQSPAFTAVALTALALGIGATTAIFSVVDAVLLRPLPFREAERLLVIYEKNPSMNRFRLMVAPGNLWEWRRQSRTLEGLAAVQPGLHANLGGGPAGPIEPEEELRVERVSAGLFPLLGVQPVVGRTFREDEDKPGRTDFALLSHSLWQRRFAADRSIAGKAIRLRDRQYTVVGVLPPGFAVLDPQVDLWVPLGLNPNDTRGAGDRGLIVIARLRRGAGITQARSELDAIGARMEAANPAWDSGYRPSVFSFRDELVAFHDTEIGATRRALVVLLDAVGLLLLMTCANVANLLLARGSGRRKEIAIRCALGASRGRVVSQLFSESLLLALSGGALGLGVAFALVAVARWLGMESLPRLAAVRIDGPLLLFALGISLATGLLFGLAPALQVSGGNVNAALIEGGRGGSVGRRGRLLRNLLVVVEVTFAVVLLIGAGLLIQTFTRLRSTSPGFRTDRLLTFRLPLVGRLAASRDRSSAFLQEAVARIAALPGVRLAAAVNVLPLTGFGSGTNFTVEGQPAAADQRPMGLVRAVTPGYFRTVGIPLTAGRDFALSDSREAAPVAIINQAMAERFWRDRSPLGHKVFLEQINNGFTASVVGAVGDVTPERPGSDAWPTIYLSYAQWPASAMVMVARTAGPPMSLASAAVREIRSMAREQAVSEVRTMDDVLDRAVADSRFNAVVLGLFAAIAFVLAAVGIYGVVSYGVTERTSELGIRMALGAGREDVLKLVLGEGARLTAYGIAAGLAAAWALTRLMASMLYGVRATDFYTFAAIAFLLGAVALMASYIPSRRAMALDPVSALRHE
jgi:putative ABC transport system permease protein